MAPAPNPAPKDSATHEDIMRGISGLQGEISSLGMVLAEHGRVIAEQGAENRSDRYLIFGGDPHNDAPSIREKVAQLALEQERMALTEEKRQLDAKESARQNRSAMLAWTVGAGLQMLTVMGGLAAFYFNKH